MNILRWFKPHKKPVAIERANVAIRMADELTQSMRSYSSGNDPIKGLMADLWQHRNNVPFVTTVYEAIQEVKPPYEARIFPRSH